MAKQQKWNCGPPFTVELYIRRWKSPNIDYGLVILETFCCRSYNARSRFIAASLQDTCNKIQKRVLPAQLHPRICKTLEQSSSRQIPFRTWPRLEVAVWLPGKIICYLSALSRNQLSASAKLLVSSDISWLVRWRSGGSISCSLACEFECIALTLTQPRPLLIIPC